MATCCHVAAAGRILAALGHVPPYRAAAGGRTVLDHHVPPYHAAVGDRTGAGWGEAVGAVGIAVAVADTVAAEDDRIPAAEALQRAEMVLGLVSAQTSLVNCLSHGTSLCLQSQGGGIHATYLVRLSKSVVGDELAIDHFTKALRTTRRGAKAARESMTF